MSPRKNTVNPHIDIPQDRRQSQRAHKIQRVPRSVPPPSPDHKNHPNSTSVPPAELEALLLSHDKIADAAVIGILSPSDGNELPRAYVVPVSGLKKEEVSILPKEIASWVESRVANYKRLRGGVVLVEMIPKTASGKILRKDLREMAKREISDSVRAKL